MPKEKNSILTLLGTSDQFIEFDEILDFYLKYLHILNSFVKHVDGFELYNAEDIFSIGFNFLKSLPLQLSCDIEVFSLNG